MGVIFFGVGIKFWPFLVWNRILAISGMGQILDIFVFRIKTLVWGQILYEGGKCWLFFIFIGALKRFLVRRGSKRGGEGGGSPIPLNV